LPPVAATAHILLRSTGPHAASGTENKRSGLRLLAANRLLSIGCSWFETGRGSQQKSPRHLPRVFLLSNQDGKTIAEKALFYKGFGRFSHCKFHFALLVFEPLTPMYFIKIFRSIKIVCGYTKKSPLNRTHWFGFER